MAKLGVKKFQELVGRTDFLKPSNNRSTKGSTLDLSLLLTPALELRPNTNIIGGSVKQNFDLNQRADNNLIAKAQPIFDGSIKTINISSKICNEERSYGSTLSYTIAKYRSQLLMIHI